MPRARRTARAIAALDIEQLRLIACLAALEARLEGRPIEQLQAEAARARARLSEPELLECLALMARL